MPLEPGTEVIAQFNYAGTSKEDLPFKKDELLRVVAPTKDGNWVRAENLEGCEGLVPASYLRRKPRVNLERMEFFHGDLSRAETEKALRGAEDGRYLVRHSTNYPGDFTLSIAWHQGVEHYRIQLKADQSLTCDDEEFFPTLPQLIAHYEEDADGLCCRLTRPIPSREAEKRRTKDVGVDVVDSAAVAVSRQSFAGSSWAIRLKDLQIGDSIGKGEFADVRIGVYRDRKVAIKAMKANAAEALIKEAALMMSLTHKNLVQLLGVVVEEGKDILMVTEFMPNGNLVDYLRSRGRHSVTPLQQISFACDACEGMAYLESKNVVHRDLAARNILLASDASAKVSDFGLARAAGAPKKDEDPNGKFPIKWTAPEALRFSNFSSKSDMWSFGVLLWEIYSFGRVPYPRIPIQDVVRHIEKGYRMEPPEGVPAELTSLMNSAWALQPSQRPTFKQMLLKLQAFEAGADIS